MERGGRRIILVVDVEGFGDHRRTDRDQVVVRAGLYQALVRAFDVSGTRWGDCTREDRGDGVFVLPPEDAPKAPFVDALPHALVAALCAHNANHPAEQRIRLRMALHTGHVELDKYGATSSSVNLTFRLLDCRSVKDALAGSGGVLALAVSDRFFNEAVRRSGTTDPATYRPVRVTVKETTAVTWIGLPDRPYPSDPGVLSAAPPVERTGPRQLPAAPRAFTGRETELAALSAAAAGPDQQVSVSTIAGGGGMGKTWLALRWAHEHADQFPDGHLFVDLRGFSPDSEPMTAETALRGFLDALGVEPAQMPTETHALIARYRSVLAGKRVLIVLDNAAGTDQVVPLLPGGSTAAVLITSRSHLPGLVAAHGARPVPVEVLSDSKAWQLVAARLGAERVAAEPAAVEELIAFCGGYPLALGIVAGRAQVQPRLRLRTLAAQLRDTTFAVLDEDEPAASLPTVLSWSYDELDGEQTRAFCLLAIAPGPDIGLAAAIAVCAMPADEVHRVLGELESASLLEQRTPGRYQMHDLVRLFAAGRAEHDVPPPASTTGLRQLADFYLRTACAGDHLIFPHRQPVEPTRLADKQHELVLRSPESAIAWFDAEHRNLLAVQQCAIDRGWDTTVWQLAWATTTIHYRRGHVHACLDSWRTGLRAADRLGDNSARILAHRHIGDAYARLDRHEEALAELEHARVLADDAGDLRNAARSHYDLAQLWGKLGDDGKALEHGYAALARFRALDLPVWIAAAMNVAGWHEIRLGRHGRAQELCQAALTLFSKVGNRDGVAHALHSLGYLAYQESRYTDAVERYEEALVISREVGHVYLEADTLDHLAVTYTALDQHAQARSAWRQASRRYETQHRITDRDRARQRLDELNGRTPD
jgi:hypothetical protein